MSLSQAQNIFMPDNINSIVLLATKIREFHTGRKPTTENFNQEIHQSKSTHNLGLTKTIILVIQRRYRNTSHAKYHRRQVTWKMSLPKLMILSLFVWILPPNSAISSYLPPFVKCPKIGQFCLFVCFKNDFFLEYQDFIFSKTRIEI